MLLAHLGPGSALLQVSWVYKVTGYEGRKLYIHPPSIEPKSRLLRVTGRVPQERWAVISSRKRERIGSKAWSKR